MKKEDVPLYKAWKGEKVENIEMLIIPESGEKKFVYASCSLIKDADVMNNTYPGLGLGLYITSEIIKRHSGSIDFISEENKGSTFCFSLPTSL